MRKPSLLVRLACLPIAAASFASFPSALTGQEQDSIGTGTLVGQVVDAKSGQPLSDVGVQLVGTTRGAQTGIDGRFRFQNVPPGPLTIQARRLGYQPKQI